MKRVVIIIVSFLAAASLVSYYLIPRYALGLIHNYEPYLFERVLNNDTMKVNYGIYENRTPKDYGFDYEDINYLSLPDSIELSAWFVQTNSNLIDCIVLVHGRTSNRLKTMKYLELFRENGLDTLYNIFIPDLRNSGKSEDASTSMGYEFAEDIASSLIWLKKNRKQNNFILYSFSMGGMATATLLNRDELTDQLKNNGILISKIILDSPLSNVEKTLRQGSARLGLPDFITDKTWRLFNDELNGFPDKMKFSELLQNVDAPILILQGSADHQTKMDFLIEEIDELKSLDITLEIFEGAGHVKLFQEEKFRHRYSQLVSEFIRSKKLEQLQ